jgi:hypothetical protein
LHSFSLLNRILRLLCLFFLYLYMTFHSTLKPKDPFERTLEQLDSMMPEITMKHAGESRGEQIWEANVATSGGPMLMHLISGGKEDKGARFMIDWTLEPNAEQALNFHGVKGIACQLGLHGTRGAFSTRGERELLEGEERRATHFFKQAFDTVLPKLAAIPKDGVDGSILRQSAQELLAANKTIPDVKPPGTQK